MLGPTFIGVKKVPQGLPKVPYTAYKTCFAALSLPMTNLVLHFYPLLTTNYDSIYH